MITNTPWTIDKKVTPNHKQYVYPGHYCIYDAHGNTIGAIKGKANADFMRVLIGSYTAQKKEKEAKAHYQRGYGRVKTTPQPKNQKFPIGTRVEIVPDLEPFHMSHFPSGYATVKYTYAHAYGGNDVKSYCLDVDGRGEISWYPEECLTLMPRELNSKTAKSMAALYCYPKNEYENNILKAARYLISHGKSNYMYSTSLPSGNSKWYNSNLEIGDNVTVRVNLNVGYGE
jgi:hypothetical protein